jgi:CrcB protein
MGSYLYVAIGSAIGGLARFVLGSWFQRRLDEWMPRAGVLPFPVGTLIVNVTGSFILGVLAVAVARDGDGADVMRWLLAVGFCGGYTTFSTFSHETVVLMERGAGTLAAVNVAASLALAFLGTFAGVALGRTLLPARL